MRLTKEKWERLAALADRLANISMACERMGISRSLYYKLIKASQAGLENGSTASTRRRHPHSIPKEVKDQIEVIARSHPEWGCQRISYFLELGGKKVSSTTVHKVLKERQIARETGINRKKVRETKITSTLPNAVELAVQSPGQPLSEP